MGVTPAGGTAKNAALHINGGDLTLRNMALNVTAPGYAGIGGILFEDGTLTLDGVNIEKVQNDGGLNGNQNGVALLQYGGTLYVNNSTFKDFNKQAISVFNGHAEIENSHFEGAGNTSVNGQNGVQFGYRYPSTDPPNMAYAPTGKVNNCTFKNFWYADPTNAVATALLIFKPADVICSGNTYKNCQYEEHVVI